MKIHAGVQLSVCLLPLQFHNSISTDTYSNIIICAGIYYFIIIRFVTHTSKNKNAYEFSVRVTVRSTHYTVYHRVVGWDVALEWYIFIELG